MVKKTKQTEESDKEKKSLEAAMMALEKQFGKGIIITDKTLFPDIEFISSGSVSLDIALNGGYPRGRIIELYGKESSGKTTLALHTVAEAQKKGGMCAFIDVEHALDINYAKRLGVDTETLLLSQPDCGEQALQVANMLTRSGTVSLVVIDSVAALVPRTELEGEIGDSRIGLQARLMSQAMRMLVGSAKTTNTTIIFINQMRLKVGVIFGSPEVTPGGEALKFYASQRLDIRRIAAIGSDDHKIGIRSRIKVVKNKVGPPFRMTELNIIFGKGIDTMTDLLDMAVAKNIVNKSGAWFSYNKENIGQGVSKAAEFLEENPKIANEIRDKLQGKNPL